MARDAHYDIFKKNKSSELKQVRHASEYLFILVLRFIAELFSIKINQKMGEWFGKFAYRLARKDRGIAQYQLDFAFPEVSVDERRRILQNTFENMGISLFEALAIKKIRKTPTDYIRLTNSEIIHEALASKNGAVLLFGHVGNWELLPTIYDMLRIKGIAVESPIGDNRLDAMLLEVRKSDNISMIPRGDIKSARSILSCFRNNEVFLYAIDQDTKVKTVFVDFFGRKAATAKGAATFAHKFNAPVISAFGARMKDGTHHYNFELLSQQPYQGTAEEELKLTQLYTAALEKHIRRYPSQWVWFHRRWKTQPGEINQPTEIQE